ncbi:MAG: DUF805 domain-containing protein [Akkermansiaceae bacterium]|nr:DUF805 domain-containing protein [Akkermansiaceae bacterium]
MNQNPYATPQAPQQPTQPAAKMTIGKILFSFQGRINRAKYWGGILGMYAVIFVAAFILGAIFTTTAEPTTTDLSSNDVFAESAVYGEYSAEPEEEMPTAVLIGLGLLYIPAVWIGLALGVKRWHDRDKSGWWVLIGIIPLIGPIWTFVECGCLQGTHGPNSYGPDPLS